MVNTLRMAKRHLFRRNDGERILRERFAKIHGGSLDLENAKTFTEKVYRQLIETNRNGNPTMTRLADKFLARDEVTKIVGSQYLIPMIWNGTNPAKLPFDDLPPKCIAMPNHGTGHNIMLESPIDRKLVIETLRRWLAHNYYWDMRVMYYYEIKPRAIINQFIDDGHPDGPLDYRFWCFNGKPEAIQIDNHPHTLNAFYDRNWSPLEVTYRKKGNFRNIARPDNLDEMLSVASKLSAQFDFVRIDLYSVHDRTYFGEFTFSPTAGMNKFDPPEWDVYFGEKWHP